MICSLGGGSVTHHRGSNLPRRLIQTRLTGASTCWMGVVGLEEMGEKWRGGGGGGKEKC